MGAPIGNKNAAKAKIVADAVRKAIVQDDKDLLNTAARKALQLAAEGERWALEFIRDTMDGKPHQTATVEHVKSEKELTTDELLALINSERTASAQEGTGEPRELH